jgi:hypothetical protein
MPIPLTQLASSLRSGEKDPTAPIPGITVRRPPEMPLLLGTPWSFVNLPAPLYIPQVYMSVTVALTVRGSMIRSPVEGFIPLLASMAPNLDILSTDTSIEF